MKADLSHSSDKIAACVKESVSIFQDMAPKLGDY